MGSGKWSLEDSDNANFASGDRKQRGGTEEGVRSAEEGL